MRKILNIPFIGLSFLISITITIIGLYIFPLYFKSVINESETTDTLFGFVILLLCTLLVLLIFKILSSILKRRWESDKSIKLLKGFGGFIILIFLIVIFVIFLSLFYGLMAVLIYELCKNFLTLGQIKGVINFVTNIITLCTLPFLSHVVMTYLMKGVKLRYLFFESLKTFKNEYIKTLIIFTVAASLGYFIFIPTNYLLDESLSTIIRAICLSMIGTILIPTIFIIYQEENKNETTV